MIDASIMPYELSNQQKSILDSLTSPAHRLSVERLLEIARSQVDETELSDDELVEFLTLANGLYRAGSPLISDGEYDFTFIAELRRRNPGHPYLREVEPEPARGEKTVELPVRMLSTEKAYDFDAVLRWAKRIRNAAEKEGVDFDGLTFQAAPKLDGYAAYDDGKMLYTRGDGRRGTDISRVFDRGLQVTPGGRRGMGAGEVVVARSYFRRHLADYFDNSRNFQASLIKEKELEIHAAAAIEQGAALFYPFVMLPNWQGKWSEMEDEASFAEIIDSLWSKIDFDIDGVVIEITHQGLKEAMGATRHHHRWQIAYKKNSDTAVVTIIDVIPQTSRTGRITPVVEVEPTRLSGALIRRATAHHYNMVAENGIGPGTVIELSRSGEVIPKIEQVITPAAPKLPEKCPSCGDELIWDNDSLFCLNNMNCPAQISHSIEHFFKTLGNVDGFGPQSAKRLFEHNIRGVGEVYHLAAADFEEMGFGPKQSENLVAQLLRSRSEQIEDWRFLAAFGIHRMGLGNCEKLLAHFPLSDVITLDKETISAIKGFKEKTAEAMVRGMGRIRPLFDELYGLGFNLQSTPLVSAVKEQVDSSSPVSGKLVVFTGAMVHGKRDDMKKQARELGAKVGSSVTGKTDYLVTGARVGESKLRAARDKGVTIISEEEYLKLIET
ncbi:MAG: helix-hairpin-helix domain-containing protein [Thermodesulfobacteriota bacterium]